jgi:hypothetical protein
MLLCVLAASLAIDFRFPELFQQCRMSVTYSSNPSGLVMNLKRSFGVPSSLLLKGRVLHSSDREDMAFMRERKPTTDRPPKWLNGLGS